MVEVIDQTLVLVQEYGELELELQQPGGTTAVKLKKTAQEPTLGRHLSTRHVSDMPGEHFINYPDKAQPGLRLHLPPRRVGTI